jgi:hypothetical protein
MLKKITTKQDQKIEAAARAQFATDVIELYRAKMAGQTASHPDAEVRAVAFGLVALKQAIEPALHRHRNDPQALIYTGAIAADGIIDALTTGRDHPLWTHIAALQTATYRPGAPGIHEQQRRAMFAGVVLAYQETAGVTLTKASIAVCEGIKAKDFPVTPGQLRKWVERNDTAARTYADRFLADAVDVPEDVYSKTERILIVGREAMVSILVVPS